MRIYYQNTKKKMDEKEEDDAKYEFKGNRIKRGLYKTQNGKHINADVKRCCQYYTKM